MPLFLTILMIFPFLAFMAILLVPRKKEALMYRITTTFLALQLTGMAAFTTWWVAMGSPVLDVKLIELYRSPEFVFFIDFYFDRTTAVFAGMGILLTSMVAVFSRYYMHRDDGFKRYFGILLLFYSGYNLLIAAGNLETLFVGWEMIGITSFLLIAFYRDRYLPVKNCFKVLSFYRIGDICLMLAMWMCHHLWHRNITFSEWANPVFLQTLYLEHAPMYLFMAIMLLLAAVIKSAQFPFSTWLPRAMEGPTTSSAIFYGALSVHAGAFLLLRTFPFWEQVTAIQVSIFVVGLMTSILATATARVQPTVKTQIAYASIAQIGLIFIEIALGWHLLALFHFAGNAMLRTYQLLVSPSVLSYQIHDMFFHFKPRKEITDHTPWDKMRQALYILSIKEWNLDTLWHRWFWQPFKNTGKWFLFINNRWGMAAWLLILAAGTTGFLLKDHLETNISREISMFLSVAAFVLVLKGFSGRGDAQRIWVITFFSQFFIALSILWNRELEWHQMAHYLSGTLASAIAGYFSLRYLKQKEGDISLNRHHGHVYEYRGTALVFLLACLGMAGFPITPTFIGIDLLFTHIHEEQYLLVLLTGLNFLFLELTLLRMYIRIFLGQHQKEYHPIAFRSS